MYSFSSLLTPVILLSLLFCTACTKKEAKPQADVQRKQMAASYEPGTVVAYDCENHFSFTADIKGDSARLFLPDTAVTLLHTASASGSKYKNDTYLYWNKGDEALLETANTKIGGCTENPRASVWEKARLKGVSFRALGQEPGWLLEFYRDRYIRLLANYAQDTVVTPIPRPTFNQKEHQRVYQAQTEAHELTISIKDEPCTDSMSGFHFPSTVTIILDGNTYNGCGRTL